MVKAELHKQNIWVTIVTLLLILLWIYASFSKLFDYRHFQWEMRNQALPASVQTMLIYLLPPAEILVAASLIFQRTTTLGLIASTVLLSLFTGYIALILVHFFEYVPCSCGGILEQMGWWPHLVFNLLTLLATLTALYIIKKKGASGLAN